MRRRNGEMLRKRRRINMRKEIQKRSKKKKRGT
jgi:hypothetical protein